jgi:hypothetical protein
MVPGRNRKRHHREMRLYVLPLSLLLCLSGCIDTGDEIGTDTSPDSSDSNTEEKTDSDSDATGDDVLDGDSGVPDDSASDECVQRGAPEVQAYIASECEDAADCPQGEVCCDQYNKGLGRREGSTCETDCDVFMYGFQLCSQSCECLDGSTCNSDGYCE